MIRDSKEKESGNAVFQSEHHPLVKEEPANEEEHALSLIHAKAYVKAATMAEGGSVLDVGCNTGYGSKILADHALNVVGIDVSRTAIEFAQKHYPAENIHYQHVDGSRIDFPDSHFDFISSFQVIEHVENTARYLGEISRVLKPGGVAVFTTPNAILRIEPGAKPWNIFHVREYSPEELEDELLPFFQSVCIQGLFAEESLYLSQLTRIKRAQRIARNKIMFGLKKFVLTHFSDNWQKMAERFAKNILPTRGHGEKQDFTKTQCDWSLESLEYKSENLDTALDLMAICTKEEKQYPA